MFPFTIETYFCTRVNKVFSYNLEANSSEYSLPIFVSGIKSFNPFWLKTYELLLIDCQENDIWIS